MKASVVEVEPCRRPRGAQRGEPALHLVGRREVELAVQPQHDRAVVARLLEPEVVLGHVGAGS